jgi:hypothetical protein
MKYKRFPIFFTSFSDRLVEVNSDIFLAYCAGAGILMDPDQFAYPKHWE